MIDLRSIIALLAGTLVATVAHAESTAAQTPEPGAKSAKAAKQKAPESRSIDIKRDAKEAWAEMRKAPQGIKKGVPAAARDAGNGFKSAWNKTKDGFAGKVPPTIPDPPK